MAFSASYGRDYDEKMLDEAVAAYLIAKHKPPAEARLKALRHRYGVLSSALLHSDLYEVERKALLAHKKAIDTQTTVTARKYLAELGIDLDD